MAKQQNSEQDTEPHSAFGKLNDNLAKDVLSENLHGGSQLPAEKTEGSEKQEKAKKLKSLKFYSTDPLEEGRLRHFLNQLAKLCHLRGDLIPKAQDSLLRTFLLNRRDRHHLQQMSNAHALRSEEAVRNGNAKLALLERLEAWRKMPRDLPLLLDLAEAYIEPENFTAPKQNQRRDQENQLPHQLKQVAAKVLTDPVETEESEVLQTKQEQKPKPKAWQGFRGTGKAGPRQLFRAKQKALKRQKNLQRKQLQKKRNAVRKLKEKTARQLFQLSAWQHRHQALRYLKKAVELSVGLEMKLPDGKASLDEEQHRLRKLQERYPQVNWEYYRERIRKLKGRPPNRWPWFLLALLLLASLLFGYLHLPWRSWLGGSSQQDEKVSEILPQPSEQTLLNTPVPVDWQIPPEQDQSFDKAIQKSQRLKLTQHYVYEVQGHIRVKPSKAANWENSGSLNASEPTRWAQLRPAAPFALQLTYHHLGKQYQKRVEFSYGQEQDPNESERAPVMEGDTMLFRKVFRLPGEPHSEDRLQAKIIQVGQKLLPEFVDLTKGDFAQALNSTNMSGNAVPTVALAFRNKVQRSDGEKLRMLGYDIELQNKTRQPLDQLDLRLSWHQEDGLTAKENAAVLLESDYTLISASGSNLPGLARTTQRLWLQIPEDLSYPVEQLTPQVRIVNNRFVPSPTGSP